jgi:hypothetical protein
MSQIPNNLFKDWKEGDVVHAVDYKLERDSIKAAHNDTDTALTNLTSRVTQSEINITSNANLLAGKTDKTGNHLGTWQGLQPSDLNTGQQALNLAGKEDKSNKGIANGYASLDSGGNVPVNQLKNVVTNPFANLMTFII